MAHKPGFRLAATLEQLPSGVLGIRFELPGGVQVLSDGPQEPLSEIADVSVMYYPDQFLQIIVLHRRKGPFEKRVVIQELPPHTRP